MVRCCATPERRARPSGSRRARRARSRSSAAAHRTFTVEGHHYALLLVDDLEPGSVTPYEVRLDGELVWPPDDGRPRPVVRTRNDERRVRLVFGSCRVGGPQPDSLEPPWHDQLAREGVDALWSYSRALQRGEEEWPDALLLLGDQVYADEVSPATLAFIEGATGHERAARRAGCRLRGVHAPLPRVLVRPRHPLAALDRPERDDLRRPRRPRRLEHLLELGRGDAREAVVGRPHHRRVHGVLDLPARREPLAARARRGNDARARQARRRRRTAPPRGRPHVGPRVGREPLGLLSRLRRLAAPRRRLARRARARRRPSRDGRRGGVGLDRRPFARAPSTIS